MPKVRHIFRWDLDKTYLRSEFETVRDLVRTARKSAEERENIPGAAALIRGIRESARDDAAHLVYFLSGSPEQMRAVIERKFALDGFAPDGFVLKAAVSELLRGRFRTIKNQIPYKLGALLRGRADAPVGSKETLIGDDAESDAFIYSLYADLIAGRVAHDKLPAILSQAGAYADQIKSIAHELESIVHEPAVRRIVIHLDQRTPPAVFFDYFPLAVPIYNHLQTAIVLCLDETLPARVILQVTRELIAAFAFDVQQLINSGEDLLRRRRAYHPLGVLEKLTSELSALRDAVEPASEEPPDKAVDEATEEVIAKLAERASLLASRPAPRTSVVPGSPRDYLEMLSREQARHIEAKQKKKGSGLPPAPLEDDPEEMDEAEDG